MSNNEAFQPTEDQETSRKSIMKHKKTLPDNISYNWVNDSEAWIKAEEIEDPTYKVEKQLPHLNYNNKRSYKFPDDVP